MSVILTEQELEDLSIEREELRVKRDYTIARIHYIDRAILNSGEARLREERNAASCRNP